MFKIPGRSDRFRANVQSFRPALFRLAYMWTHDRSLADDLTQETLAKALARGAQLRDQRRLRAWLYGILTNCWRDYLRARRPMEDIDSIEEHYLASEADRPDQVLGQSQLAFRVQCAVNELPAGQRAVISLVDLGQLTYAEVAEVLEIPIGTVMSRLSRGRAALRKSLAGEESLQPAIRRVK